MDKLPKIFGLTDVLAYHFPGFLAANAVVLMRPNWLPSVLGFSSKYAVVFTILAIVVPFILGVIISGVTGAVIRYMYGSWLGKSDVLGDLVLCEKPVHVKVNRLLLRSDTDSLPALHEFPKNLPIFYICRAVVRDSMPGSYVTVDRQNALRQFRRNLIVPLVLSGVAALCLLQNQDALLPHAFWVVPLTAVIVLATMRSAILSRQREVREVFLGFLAAPVPPDRDEHS